MHQGQQLDERVVRADRERGKDLPKEYIKDRWTRETKDAYDDLIIWRPLTRVEEDDEWYVRSSSEFGSIVRKAVRCERLRPIVDMKAKELADILK
ncbi:hypothetical protein LINPERPRIM_LOCUS1987 [Linum perenne]